MIFPISMKCGDCDSHLLGRKCLILAYLVFVRTTTETLKFKFFQTWTESALMISPLSRLASSIASRLFPEPVGPDITITFSFFAPEAEQAVENTRRGLLNRNEAAWRRGLSGEYGMRRQHARRPHAPLSILISQWTTLSVFGFAGILCYHFFQRF